MDFEVIDLGLIDYSKAFCLQKETLLQIRSGLKSSTLILCSHYPVITKGRNALNANLLAGKEELRKRGICVYDVERGGDITYHGPGQLIAYPVFDLNEHRKDIRLFLRNLEESALSFLKKLGIRGERRDGLTGCWIGTQKIASIGISVRNWITFHGLSINIKRNDLENFQLIRPCGLDVKMTCAEEALGKEFDIDTLKETLTESFREVFSVKEELAHA